MLKKRTAKLSRKMNLYLAISITIVMIIFFAISIYFSHAENTNDLYTQADYIVTLASQSLEQPIWNFDMDTIKSIGDSLSLKEDLVSVQIYNGTEQELLYSHGETNNSFYSINEKVVYNSSVIGTITLDFSSAQINASLREEIITALIQLITVLLVLFTVLTITVNRITEPLLDLKQAVSSLSKGNLDTRASIHTKDEIEDLATEFNSMANTLTHKINEAKFLASHDPLTGLLNRSDLELHYEDWQDNSLYPVGIILTDINGLSIANDVYGHGFGDQLLIDLSAIIKSITPKGRAYRFGGDEILLLIPNCDLDTLKQHASIIDTKCQGTDYMETGYTSLNVAVGYQTHDNLSHGIFKSIDQAEEIMNRKKLLQEQSLHSGIISYLKNTLNERSKETFEHTERLNQYSMLIASQLKLKEDDLNKLTLFSSLHDLGKIAIPDAILLKPGALDSEEWKIMKTHSEVGYRLAMTSGELTPIADLILCHHEKWDGNGYPRGLKGEEIPLLARILAIADAYDAMTEDRVYRPKLSVETALSEISKNSGSQFDPLLVDIFIEEMKKLPQE